MKNDRERWRSDRRGSDRRRGPQRQPRNAGQGGRQAAEGRCRRGSEGTGIPIGIGIFPSLSLSFLSLLSWHLAVGLVRFFLRLACLLFSCFTSTFFVGWSLFPYFYFPLCCLCLWRAPSTLRRCSLPVLHTSHNILLGFSKSPGRSHLPRRSHLQFSCPPGGAMQGEKLPP